MELLAFAGGNFGLFWHVFYVRTTTYDILYVCFGCDITSVLKDALGGRSNSCAYFSLFKFAMLPVVWFKTSQVFKNDDMITLDMVTLLHNVPECRKGKICKSESTIKCSKLQKKTQNTSNVTSYKLLA